MEISSLKRELQYGNIFWKSFNAFAVFVNNKQHWKTKMGRTTLLNYCTYSVQTTKTFYVNLKEKLGIYIHITMCKIKFWISWLFWNYKVESNPRMQIFVYNCWQRYWREQKRTAIVFCLWPVDENLNAFKDFINFHQLENIKSDTIVYVIKDILIRMNLSLSNCRGQTYDGASNMMEKKSEFRLKFLQSSQKLLTYTVKDIPSECQWNQWLMKVTFCRMSLALLEKFAYLSRFHQNGNIY